MFTLYLLSLLLQPPPPAPAVEPLPTCAPPPKVTVTVACEPGEGCEDKWIFVEPDLPTS
jgi:hypothetical protein